MSSDPPAPGSGPSEEGLAAGHVSDEKDEAEAVCHVSEEKAADEVASDGDQARHGSELESPGKRSQVSTEGRQPIGPVPKKAKQEQAEAEKGMKKLVTTKEKAQHTKTSAAGEGYSVSPAESVSSHPQFAIRHIPNPRFKLPTMRKPKDPETTKAVRRQDKKMVMDAARSIVSVSSIGHDGVKIQQCSGIVICQRECKVIIATCSIVVCDMDELLDPLPKLSIRLADADRTVLEGTLVFFNYHYDLVLLEIEAPFPVHFVSIGSCPQYDQEIYALARGEESELMVRHGKIDCLGESDHLGRDYYVFLSCEIPQEGTGGPVVDLKGRTVGMAFSLSPSPAVISITTIKICTDMWLQFGRIARPLHGLSLRLLELLDLELQEEIYRCHGISTGFIVDKVSYDSAAESLGIEYGDVICSFDDQHVWAPTLPQVNLISPEDYLLNLGRTFLENPNSTFELK
ncbi:hypothetical protein EJB05_40030, partial [Eragrostis curvula]